jgi:voltage-gated potassium channel
MTEQEEPAVEEGRPMQRLARVQTSRFLRETPTVRNAATVIVTLTAAVVGVSAVAMRLFDAHEFPNVWLAVWWALQTVTTVGYGDVAPHATSGRIVGVVVMLEGIALIAIVTAAITSTFVERARRELTERDLRQDDLETRIGELIERLDRIEPLLQASTAGSEGGPKGSTP